MATALQMACPAGEPLADPRTGPGPGCRCKVEHSTLAMTRDPRVVPSVLAYCYGDYTRCPTWRAERQRRTAAPIVDEREG